MSTICKNCCEAGEYNKHGNKHVDKGEADMAELAYSAAQELHAECVGSKSCLCQHRTGKMVQA